MNNRVTIGSMYPLPGRPADVRTSSSGPSILRTSESQFEQVLQQQQLQLIFSQHAVQRIQQRGIEMPPETMTKLANAVDQAASKGAVDSLIVMPDVALIVNVPNRTVVTAMDHTQLSNTVFTQIDSAVILH
ncbi:flagellar operon protein [Paenibacillus cellulosilyticus]|uniref:Flagellar operon protein n=1 Tax=Paenibacillus cellulosilyticus TaxID=375489 RepID=A0A2V2Z6C6_9BACL|nr:TIGR02530 family flagellar biosynthesis protein [Paenibacillus cellulosilyticus]PWW06400.1 flagellar operon protein [Paenibacillus cellulosilyticus]QKS46254.1 flagellar biosynthesis protein [Paenibacillus cellulosilyticus]